MSIKSGLFAALTAVVLILALGNGAVGDNLPNDTITATAASIHGFFLWDLGGFPGKVKTGQYAALVVFVGGVFVLGGLAGRARPLAAFIGGWGASIGAAALAGAVYTLIVGDEVGFGGSGDIVDRLYLTSGNAAGVMVWLGWLFGIAVMLGSFGKNQPRTRQAVPMGGYAPPPGPQWNQGPAPAPPPPAPAPAPAAGYGAAPAATPPPAPPPPPPTPAPELHKPPPAAPQIGAPPDRTQVYGQPPQH